MKKMTVWKNSKTLLKKEALMKKKGKYNTFFQVLLLKKNMKMKKWAHFSLNKNN